MSYQVLGTSISILEMAATLWEMTEEDFDKTLVPGGSHSEEAALPGRGKMSEVRGDPSQHAENAKQAGRV